MMMEFANIKLMIMLLWIMVVTSQAVAGTFEYKCTIIQIYKLNDDGLLKNDRLTGHHGFTVSRETGEIKGMYLPTLRASSIEVLNRGSDEWSFKTVSTYAGKIDASGSGEGQYLEVREFVKSDNKPFYALSSVGVVTGICK